MTIPQPGIVECQLEDGNGNRILFIEKTAVVDTESAGREVVRIDTERPLGVLRQLAKHPYSTRQQRKWRTQGASLRERRLATVEFQLR